MFYHKYCKKKKGVFCCETNTPFKILNIEFLKNCCFCKTFVSQNTHVVSNIDM
jgi:hypothetical protein